jgi:hypothetical protein
MIEGLTVDRQYLPQKKFPFLVRNFRTPGEPYEEPRRIRRQAPIPVGTAACPAKREALFVATSATGLDRKASHS